MVGIAESLFMPNDVATRSDDVGSDDDGSNATATISLANSVFWVDIGAATRASVGFVTLGTLGTGTLLAANHHCRNDRVSNLTTAAFANSAAVFLTGLLLYDIDTIFKDNSRDAICFIAPDSIPENTLLSAFFRTNFLLLNKVDKGRYANANQFPTHDNTIRK